MGLDSGIVINLKDELLHTISDNMVEESYITVNHNDGYTRIELGYWRKNWDFLHRYSILINYNYYNDSERRLTVEEFEQYFALEQDYYSNLDIQSTDDDIDDCIWTACECLEIADRHYKQYTTWKDWIEEHFNEIEVIFYASY